MMLIEDQIEDYKVQIKDGDENRLIKYKIRGLKSNVEISEWSKFCANVFKHKTNPPSSSYFERHYYNDPFRDKPSLIRVATISSIHEDDDDDEEEEEEFIVASCRLFLRTISCPSQLRRMNDDDDDGNDVESGSSGCLTDLLLLSAGGIGEVCTDENHRRRGLSKVLLQNCLSIMIERKLQLSLLHAAPTFFGVYEKTGNYKCSTSRWSTIEINYNNLLSSTTKVLNLITDDEKERYVIRKAKFPDDSEMLLQLHQRYSEQRFAGCIVRSIDYWNNYLSQELGDSLLVLSHQDKIIGWLSIRPRGGANRIQLREFGIDDENAAKNHHHHLPGMNTSKILTMLLSSAIRRQSQTIQAEENFILSLPTFVINQVRQDDDDGVEVNKEKDSINNDQDQTQQCFLWPTLKSDDDMGWMYRVLDDQVVDLKMIDGTNNIPHLIWPSDSF